MVNNSTYINKTITTHWIQKLLRDLTLKMLALAWDRHKDVAMLNRLTGSQSYLLKFTWELYIKNDIQRLDLSEIVKTSRPPFFLTKMGFFTYNI